MAMSTLTSVGPMLIMDSASRATLPQGMPSATQCIIPSNAVGQYMTPNGVQFPHHLAAATAAYRGGVVPAAPSSAATSSGSSPAANATSTSMNRSQRCGVCRGCQCKPCGTCTYCQDSPQFGGPGVKKQSCIERRCLRVLENRLQRDVPGFKARVGCNNCDDCRQPDCQVCLVCLDKRFFDNRYMTGALCAKKRCNNATSLELPSAQNSNDRQVLKRTYDNGANFDYMSKRRGVETQSNNAANGVNGGAPSANGARPPHSNGHDQLIYATGTPPHLQSLRVLPPPPGHALAHHINLLVPMSTVNGGAPFGELTLASQSVATSQSAANGDNGTSANVSSAISQHTPIVVSTAPGVHSAPLIAFQPTGPHNGANIYTHFGFPPNAQFDAMTAAAGNIPAHLMPHYPQQKLFTYPKYEYYENDNAVSPQDPFLPPSYAPEMKNAVVLQPL